MCFPFASGASSTKANARRHFSSATPPDKLQLTLARIAGMVGAENVGTPVLLNTHRPDAFLNEASLLPEEREDARPEMLRRYAAVSAGSSRASASGEAGAQKCTCSKRQGTCRALCRPVEDRRRMVDAYSLEP